ncbi:hypothetical protein F442_22556 [Phytophthora nicotianae P10297]|uniref:Uncharacterized protein n=3 Tax=Phytophthora nicotianae TaxID=4792 RepID=W2Y0A5_PHYNI|nr:hypothetical protein F444_00783 [Phytophthora nicotianae P1976]ETP28157.1 hypothetical protein F442_22556 [Phytophthora nicotianae P10297]
MSDSFEAQPRSTQLISCTKYPVLSNKGRRRASAFTGHRAKDYWARSVTAPGLYGVPAH